MTQNCENGALPGGGVNYGALARVVVCAAACLAGLGARAADAYIEADGNQWIVTDYYPSKKTKIVADFQWVTKVAQARLFGTSNIGANDFTCSFFLNSGLWFAYGFQDKAPATWPAILNGDLLRRRICLDAHNGKGTLSLYDGTDESDSTVFNLAGPFNNAAQDPLHLFTSFRNGKLHNGNNNYKAKVKLYSLQIYDDNELVHDYQPRIKGRVAGLKDLVTGVFYASVGDKPFKCGGDIVDEDAYIEATGSQWICTDYYPSKDTKIEIDFQFVQTNGQMRVFGSEHNAADGMTFTVYITGSGALAFADRDGETRATIGNDSNQYGEYRTGFADTQRHFLSLSGPDDTFIYYRDLYGDSVTQYTITGTMTLPTRTAVYPILLFSSVRDGVLHRNPSYSYYAQAKMRLYSCRIHEFDHEQNKFVLMRDYKPIIRNGVPGLRDLVSGRFSAAEAYGETSEPFLYGGDIERVVEPDTYVEAAGHQWFETGYYPSGETTILTDFKFTSIAEQMRVFGVSLQDKDNTDLGVTCSAYLNSGKEFAYNVSDYTNHVWQGLYKVPTAHVRYKMNVLRPSISNIIRIYGENASGGFDHYVGSKMVRTATQTALTNLFLFTSYRDGYLHRGKTAGQDYRAKLKMYGCKIYDAGLLARDYVPQVVDGVAGMMDRVANKFYPSAEEPFKFGVEPCPVTDGNVAVFADQDIVMNGGILDLGGRSLTVKSLSGWGTVTNGVLTVTEKLVFDAAAPDGAQGLAFAAETDVTLPATVEIRDADRLNESGKKRRTLCTFAAAQNAAPAVASALPKPWRLELTDGGHTLQLVSPTGMCITVR